MERIEEHHEDIINVNQRIRDNLQSLQNKPTLQTALIPNIANDLDDFDNSLKEMESLLRQVSSKPTTEKWKATIARRKSEFDIVKKQYETQKAQAQGHTDVSSPSRADISQEVHNDPNHKQGDNNRVELKLLDDSNKQIRTQELNVDPKAAASHTPLIAFRLLVIFRVSGIRTDTRKKNYDKQNL
ncbi:hypothetical protein RFI_01511 [Reticulomyxa filosa]|uniref:Uncharacterized protein n=1 Tax=Reticulomyxa filosa TaxID=46433 RepID=X6PBR3_RETFI|nr:hypothetical protein RFI_01511 [Reticulomyxa filosa]|eukprot:ETO35558.1 hypothetical protein RFI_01511 [Reticulomyxa filosa]